MTLSIRNLNLEYLTWSLNWGNNVNNEGISFSQYLEDKYTSCVFHSDDINVVYNETLENLNKDGQKTTT